jgi:REP element-mobilizing transposase RayT
MMAKTRPPFLPGHYYHFYNRGAHRASIFKKHDNYIFVIRKIKEYSRQFNFVIIAYCLMPNHYHILMRQAGDVLARLLPQRVFNSYVKAYNQAFDHSGTLFEGPYKVDMIERESHLRHLCRYIHANPVKDGLVQHPADWQYSNYLEWMEQRAGALVDREFIQAYFGDVKTYEEFVQDYLLMRRESDELDYLQW